MSACIIICLLLGVATASIFDDELVRNYSIPLIRAKSPLKILASRGVHPSKIEELLAYTDTTNTSVPLYKFLDMEFFGEVLIGHPGQKFSVAFDTAWSNCWVPSSRCSIIRHIDCALHERYDSSRSSMYVPTGKTINLALGPYNMSGMLSTDLFHVGKINVTNQTFAEIENVPWVFALSRADGILGLGFQSFSVGDVVPLFYNMVKQRSILKPVFSFYMNRDPSSSRAGTLFFGGVEERHYKGNFTFSKITKIGYWQFRMDSVNVKGSYTTLCKGGCEAYADTSAMSILGPTADILAINRAIKAKPFFFGRYVVDCALMGKLPAVTFTISGRPFTLKSSDYVQKMAWGGAMICMSSFAESGGDIWSMGAAFLSRFYVQFDLGNNRIGFADALLL